MTARGILHIGGVPPLLSPSSKSKRAVSCHKMVFQKSKLPNLCDRPPDLIRAAAVVLDQVVAVSKGTCLGVLRRVVLRSSKLKRLCICKWVRILRVFPPLAPTVSLNVDLNAFSQMIHDYPQQQQAARCPGAKAHAPKSTRKASTCAEGA